MNGNQKLMASGLWRWLQGTGLERFEFLHSGEEWIFRGTVLTQAGNAAAEARYQVICDAGFRTRDVQVSLRSEGPERMLHIEASDGRWLVNGIENPAVRGAIDIDLGWSPSTNTLPIRRLALKVGQSSGEMVAAWVRFPELTLEPLPQEYFRTAEQKYRYSSRSGGFNAELLVDEHGLVMEYEGFWRREF